jgi:exopolysaccharide/PEP-CTERM locus tyrosine autokinase
MSRIEKALEMALKLREPSQQPATKAAGASVVAPWQPRNPNILSFDGENVLLNEQYRKLKSVLLLMTRRKGGLNTLMVTSAECGEGKSLTAINLALVLAQDYNHTVLLIDADLRRPSLQSYLGLEPTPGLSDCLLDGVDVGRALIRVGTPKLTYMSAGRKVDNPAELLSSNKMKDLLHEMKGRYRDRYIIIDTPPVLPFAETHSLSSCVDGVLFVVKEGVSHSSVKSALDILKDGPLLGIVYNNARKERLNGRYAAYYPEYYGIRNGTDDGKGRHHV